MTVPRERAKSGNSLRVVDVVTQKSAKKKSKKADKATAQAGVLGSLPAARPERIGGTRRASTNAERATTTTKPQATNAERAAASKAPATNAERVKAKPAKAAKAKPAKAKAKATPAAAKAKPSKPAAVKPAKVKPVRRIVPGPEPVAKPGPTPSEAGEGRASGPARGAEIVTTAVQAAGELAQIGATVGGQLLRRAARRIPRR
jgi:hypothetical protein